MGEAIPKHLMQHAFTTGEMSPMTLGRQDVAKYASGVQTLENFQVTPQGAILSDTGTVFVNSAKFSNSAARLIPFVFSNQQSYIVELGNLYARFYINGGQIQSGGSPVEVVTPYLAAELAAIQFCQSADYLYLVHPNHPPAAITRTSNTTWNYAALTFEDGPYQDDNLNPVNTLTASALTGSVTLTANFAAFFSGNVGAFVRLEEAVTTVYNQWTPAVCYQNGEYVTNAGRVYRCSGAGGTITPWTSGMTTTNPGFVTNAGNIYATYNAGTAGSTGPTFTSGTQTVGGISYSYLGALADISSRLLGEWQNGVAYPTGYYVYWGNNCYVSFQTATSGSTPPTHTTGFASDGGENWLFIGKKSGTRAPIFVSGTDTDGNLSWTYLHSGFGYAKITAYTDAEHVTATVISTQLPNSVTGGTLQFRLGAWDTYNGYPGVICFYESRLCFAGSTNFPETIWMSCTDDYYNFAPTDTGTNVLDTNAINITLASGTLNQIVWMLPVTRLLVGTIGSEWQIWQSNTSSGFSPSNVQAKQMSVFGSAPVKPQLMYQSVLYTHRSQARVYEATYNYIYDLYVSKDLNLLSDHILREGGGVSDTAVQLSPLSTMWLLRDDGQLIGLTYLNDEQITAWHRHVYQGQVVSIACIPNSETNSDQLWMVIQRTINGSTVYYIETMQAPFYPANPQDKSGMWYVECGLSLTVTGSPVTTISGLGYLQGETVVAIVDGAVQPPQIVPSSGTLTLQVSAKSQVVVGLPYISTVTILPLDFEGQKGTIQGQTQRVHRVRLRLLTSLGFTAYPNDNPTQQSVESFRSTSGNMDESPDLFTGDWPTLLPMGKSPDGVFTIQQTQPYPLNILGIISEVTGYEP
jgi:hypothetical protein